MLYHKRRIQRKAENKSSLFVTAKGCLKIELEFREAIYITLVYDLFLISAIKTSGKFYAPIFKPRYDKMP